MLNRPLPRLDQAPELHDSLVEHCRLRPGEVWADPLGRHRVGCIDAADSLAVNALMGGQLASLAIQDPPYNQIAFGEVPVEQFVAWCERWVESTKQSLQSDAAMYVWLGADQTNGFQPLPDFMIMMRSTEFRPRSFVTVRNQRGYGTSMNWMAVRQELLYYTKGKPKFNVDAEYTDIPKILRGYYKEVNGARTENLERSKSNTIRAGNVWVDIQQVFYRLEENVNGCYAQKPLPAIKRIVGASSAPDDVVLDLFSHSGTTLIAAEMLGRRCCTADVDPVFCEIAIRRLERFRTFGKSGWQAGHPFEDEEVTNPHLQSLLKGVRPPTTEDQDLEQLRQPGTLFG